MQCPVCHNEVGAQSAFCGHCGAPIAAAAAPSVPPQSAYVPPPATGFAPPAAGYPPPAAGYPPPVAAASPGLSPNAAAALSYVTIIPAILFLIIEPYSKIPLVRFHAMQSIGLAVVWFVLWIAIFICSMFFAFIPGLHFIMIFLFPLLHFALLIGLFILWLICVLKASKGEWFKIPMIGDFAMKQAQS
jgi:uncharacterized membrane protein